MSYLVSSVNLGSISLNESDPVKSVLQNIATTVNAPVSVPLYRKLWPTMQFIRQADGSSQALVDRGDHGCNQCL